MVVLGLSNWKAGAPVPAISRDTLLRKNAVGIETDFLNEETGPFPRLGSIPGYTKAIWLRIKERPAVLGLCGLAVSTVHGWV